MNVLLGFGSFDQMSTKVFFTFKPLPTDTTTKSDLPRLHIAEVSRGEVKLYNFFRRNLRYYVTRNQRLSSHVIPHPGHCALLATPRHAPVSNAVPSICRRCDKPGIAGKATDRPLDIFKII